MRLVVSLVQMDVALGKPEVNLARVREQTREAARRGARLVVLPELWSTGYDLEHAAGQAAAPGTGIFAAMSDLAREQRVHLAGSCLSLLGPDRFGNTLLLAAPDGPAAYYSKLHLFRLMDEHRYLTAGERPVLAETPWGKAGLAICYDLRFPELFRLYALAGARLILLVAEWPYPRLVHWQTLLRARAIENQLYVVACNRVGSSGETRFFGHSCVIGPDGAILAEGGTEEELLTVELDLERVGQVRAAMPVFGDRRPEVYRDDNKKVT